MLKALCRFYLAWYFGIPPVYLGFIGIAACLGIYPLYFHFRGGKGVATALWRPGCHSLDMGSFRILTWLLILLLTGYSSMAALAVALLVPLYTYCLKPEYVSLPVACFVA